MRKKIKSAPSWQWAMAAFLIETRKSFTRLYFWLISKKVSSKPVSEFFAGSTSAVEVYQILWGFHLLAWKGESDGWNHAAGLILSEWRGEGGKMRKLKLIRVHRGWFLETPHLFTSLRSNQVAAFPVHRRPDFCASYSVPPKSFMNPRNGILVFLPIYNIWTSLQTD